MVQNLLLERLVLLHFDFYMRYPDYFKAMLHEEIHDFEREDGMESPFVSECKDIGSRIFYLMQEVIQMGINDHSIRSDLDPVKLSVVLWGQSTGVLQILKKQELIYKGQMEMDSEQIVTYSLELIKKYIQKKDR